MLVIFLLLLQVLLLAIVIILLRTKSVSVLLSSAILFQVGMWYIAPITIGVLRGRGLYASALIDGDGFVEFATIESLLLIVSLLFLLRRKPYFSLVTNGRLARYQPTPLLGLAVVIFGMFLTLLSAQLAGGYSGASYIERNAFAIVAQGEQEFNTLGSFAFVQSLLVSFGYVAVITKWPNMPGKRLVKLAALTWITVLTVQGVIQGGRIMMFVPIMIVVMYARVHEWTKKRIFTTLVLVTLIALPVSSLLSIVIARSRGTHQMNWEDVVSGSLSVASRSTGVTEISDEFVAQVVTKFDSFSAGAFLVEFGGKGSAGLRPYVGSLVSMIPRALLPSKPVPGSIDGTYRGHPSRIVPALGGNADVSSNVGVSPGAISIWQFGYLGLIALVVSNVVNLYLVNSLLLSPSKVSKSLGMFLMGLPTLTTLFASPDVLIMNWERVLVVYAVLSAGLIFTSRRRPASFLSHRFRAALPRT